MVPEGKGEPGMISGFLLFLFVFVFAFLVTENREDCRQSKF